MAFFDILALNSCVSDILSGVKKTTDRIEHVSMLLARMVVTRRDYVRPVATIDRFALGSIFLPIALPRTLHRIDRRRTITLLRHRGLRRNLWFLRGSRRLAARS